MEHVMDFTGCSKEEAIRALEIHGDIFDATLSLMPGSTVALPKQKVMDEQQLFFSKIRNDVTKLTESISKGFISNQSEPLERSETQIPHEETVQQNNCSQEYHPPSPVSEVEIPGIVCQLPSESTCDLPSNGQI